MRVVFVTDRRDSHAERFSTAFHDRFSDYQWIVVEHDSEGRPSAIVDGVPVHGWGDIGAALDTGDSVVVSGPLDSVTTRLALTRSPHFGISWATDVMVTAGSSEESLRAMMTTVRSLEWVITDNIATENALVACGVEPQRIIRFPWGPDTTNQSQPDRSRWGLPEQGPVGLFARSLDPHYDPLTFLDALAVLKQRGVSSTWCLLERGALVDTVREALERKGLSDRVVWLASRSSEEFTAMLASFDCVVSTPVTDGTSVTVMEAMRAGVPVVATLTNGAAEWIVDGVTGWTSPVGDSTALADALERAFSASAERQHLIVENARRLVDVRAGWQTGVEKLLAAVAHEAGVTASN